MTRKAFLLLLLWIFVIGIGLSIGLVIGSSLETDEDSLLLFLLLGFAIGGALIGFGQWVLFDTDHKLSWLWIPATAFGMPFGLLFGFFVIELWPFLPEELYWLDIAAITLIAGIITGVIQRLLTQGILVSRRWVIVSAISFLGLAFFFPNTDNPIYTSGSENWVLNLMIYGSLYGIFAGTISGIFFLSKLSTNHVKHRLSGWKSITFLSTLAIASIVGKLFLYDNGYSNPLLFSSYSSTGYYEIYPETILSSLDRGETRVFTLASEEIWDQDRPEYESIRWSQSDYLKIADALSQEVWHEPLDLNKWQILDLSFSQDCVDNPHGFYSFSLVYFQRAGLQFWSRQYHVRMIDVIAWQGIIVWGERIFSDAILPGWGNANLEDFKLTADDALLLAERNGGSKVRQGANNDCRISVWFNNYTPVSKFSHNNWLVDYGKTDFYIRINPLTGKFKRHNAD
jgi:hypothetical protein